MRSGTSRIGVITVALTALLAGPTAGETSLEDLRAAEIAEARRLAGRLDSLWPGLGEVAAKTTIVLVAEDGARIVSPGEDGRSLEADLRRRRRAPSATAIRQIDVAGERVLVLDERVEDKVRSLLQAAAGSASAGEASVAWVVTGLFVQWARARLFDDPVPGLFRSASPPPEDAAALLRVLEAPRLPVPDELMRDFVAIRRAWLVTVPDLPAAAFRRVEAERGLALHTAYVALLMAGQGGLEEGPRIRYSLAPALRDAALRALRRAATGDLEAGSAALSGFAIALILDRRVADWRRRLRSGEPVLDRLLMEGR